MKDVNTNVYSVPYILSFNITLYSVSIVFSKRSTKSTQNFSLVLIFVYKFNYFIIILQPTVIIFYLGGESKILPRKNIYVKEEDMKFFEQVGAFGPISSVVVKALKQYIGEQKLRQQGFRDHVITVEDLKYHFVGRKVKSFKKSNKEIVVYQTKGNNFVVQHRANGKNKIDVYHSISELVNALSNELNTERLVEALKSEKIVWIH